MEEQETGLVSVAAPIRSLDGQVVAAVIISGRTFRLHEDMVPDIAPRVLAAAAENSQRNGYAGSAADQRPEASRKTRSP